MSYGVGGKRGVAVALALAGGYNYDLTPSLRTSICCRCGPKKTKKKKVEIGINCHLDIITR